MQTTPHADANRLLESLLARVQGLLREKLVGLYLYGSLATGDFDPGISDVDLLAAVASELGDSELESLRALHANLERDEPEWADRVEVAYVSLRALRTFRSERSPIAVISPGEPFHAKDAGSDWLANWYAVREEGRALFGPAPETLIDPISREEFTGCIRGYAAEWGERIHGVRERKERAYAILTMCRALHLHCRGERASKREAARWAQEELPQWSDLIGSALAWRRAWREADVDHASTRAETVRFVQFVRDRILAPPSVQATAAEPSSSRVRGSMRHDRGRAPQVERIGDPPMADRSDDGVRREKQLLIDFLCSSAGGPLLYTGRDMTTASRSAAGTRKASIMQSTRSDIVEA